MASSFNRYALRHEKLTDHGFDFLFFAARRPRSALSAKARRDREGLGMYRSRVVPCILYECWYVLCHNFARIGCGVLDEEALSNFLRNGFDKSCACCLISSSLPPAMSDETTAHDELYFDSYSHVDIHEVRERRDERFVRNVQFLFVFVPQYIQFSYCQKLIAISVH